VNEYEMMTVFHPRLNADETTAAITALEEQIVANGGEMLSTDNWGRRRLAYPIDGVADGNYVLMTFNFPPANTGALERWIRISETTLRHMLIRGIIPFAGDRDGRDRDDRDDRYSRDDRDGDRDRDDRDDDGDRGSQEPRAAESASAPAVEAADAPAEEPASEGAEPAAEAAGEAPSAEPAANESSEDED